MTSRLAPSEILNIFSDKWNDNFNAFRVRWSVLSRLGGDVVHVNRFIVYRLRLKPIILQFNPGRRKFSLYSEFQSKYTRVETLVAQLLTDRYV